MALRSQSLLAVLVCACVLPCPAALEAQQPVDTRSAQQRADSASIAGLAQTLTKHTRTDSARAAALYEWVARNLSYDLPGYLAGRVEDAGAEAVYRRRVAVCGGYVALFGRLAREAGLQVQPINGYAKGFDYRPGSSTRKPNHAWLAVQIGGRWKLIDPTWGSGYVSGGKFVARFSWDWFLVNPDALALSHFPADAGWQLVDSRLSRKEFEQMPLVPRTLVDAGFTPQAIRSAVLRLRVRNFPLVGVQPNARVISAPLAGTLARASSVTVEIVWPGASDVALVSGGIWTRLERDGDRFRGAAAVSAESLSLVGRSALGHDLTTLLHYRVE